MTGGTVALVEDDPDLAAATAQLLSLAGHTVQRFADGATALAAVDALFPGVVVSDIRMPGLSGIELFRRLRDRDPELPVILVTGHADVATAVDALKAGAWDFLTKPFDPDMLIGAVGRAMATRRLVIENRRLRAAGTDGVADRLIGCSPAIRRLRGMIPMLGETGLHIVVEGATGTGKALLARLIHRGGRRARHRFVTLDCATLSAAQGEALFAPHGPIAGADRGTLFLDNLDAADEGLQRRLTAFVEDQVVGRTGRAPGVVDLRIIAALDEGRRGAVAAPLYHRLAAVAVRLPPLAERLEDVPLLVAHFLNALAGTHRRPAPAITDAATLIGRRDWPGNVRELEQAVERLVLGLRDEAPAPGAEAPLPERVRAFERAAIVAAIAAGDGEIGRIIETLGIPRETFYYRVKRLGIDLGALRKRETRPDTGMP